MAKTDEKYAFLFYGHIRFKVSFVHLNRSLETLVKILKNEKLTKARKMFRDWWKFVKQKMA